MKEYNLNLQLKLFNAKHMSGSNEVNRMNDSNEA
jgi:hypothetical protein